MELVGHAIDFVSIVESTNRLYDWVKHLVAAQDPSDVLASLNEKASELKNDIESLMEDGPSVSKEGLKSLESQLKKADDLSQKIQNSITCSEHRPLLRKALDKLQGSPHISAMLNELDGLLGRLNKDISKLLTKSNYRAAPKFREYVPDLTPPPVGLDRVQPILSFLEEQEEGVEVRAVAIHGEGGLGKTTLLHMALNKLREKTNELKFVYVEFECEPDEEAIKSKQSSIIQQILEESEPVKLPSSAHGRDGIRRQLQLMMKKKRRICLAIDDVWKTKDLRKLLPSDLCSHLPPSSYFLLTTRSLDVVNALNWLWKPEGAASTSTQDAASTRTHNEEKRCKILPYRPEDLSKKDARELFVRHACISPSDENGVKLADEVVKLCRGLPLALEVMGGHFFSKQRRKHWKDTFRRMDLTHKSLKDPRRDLMASILRGSYKGLESDEQKAFLDVACFFDGWNWETVSAIVGSNKLDKLNTLCLVKQADRADAPYTGLGFDEPPVYTCRKVVKMHPLLVELGRCEAQRSRVRCPLGVLKDCEESELQEIEGLWDSTNVGADVLGRMKNLRVARIFVENGFPPLMKLEYLNLTGQVNESVQLPSMRRCENLSVLTLRNIRSSFDGVEFPDSLQQLRLVKCSGLVKLPSSFGRPESMLQILHIRWCSSLKRLPDTICELRRLRELVVEYCKSFVELTTSSMLTDLAELQVLRLIRCNCLTHLPKEIWGIKNLTQVRLHDCESLPVIIPSVSHLSSLQILSVCGVDSLELSGDCDIWKLHSLRQLRLEACNNMKSIPEEEEELKALGGLESLHLQWWYELQKVPKSIGALISLKELHLECCEELVELPASIEKLSSLRNLNLRGCSQITALPATITNLTALTHLSLHLGGMEELPNFGDFISLKSLCLEVCDGLEGLLSSIVKLTALESLLLWGRSDLLLEVPRSIAKLTRLYCLCLIDFPKVERLPENIGDLLSLEVLDLLDCSLVTLPHSVGQLKGLWKLSIDGCCEISELPESISNLGSLQCLTLRRCKKLTALPAGIGKLKNLMELDVRECSELKMLPD